VGVRLSEKARALIGAATDATLVTINPDGSPQASLVWIALESTPDGDELVTAHLHDGCAKVRNIRRDGRVAVTVVSRQAGRGFTPYLAISGTARLVEGGAPELTKILADVMLGPNSGFPPEDASPGFVTRIQIEKVSGPWA
jgi:PPOX class probable F420-dependent enzyme